MIRVGVIGNGYIGQVHLEALARVEGVEAAIITDTNQALAAESARRFGIEKVAADWREIVYDPSIDVIHNCTPNRFHFEINKASLLEGKPVLSEKPLAMTYKEAAELADLSEQKSIITGIDFCYRYYPVIQELAARIADGECGDVRVVTGTWFQDWLSKSTDYSWRLDPLRSGESNITADLGSHWFDLVQYLTGLSIDRVRGDFATIIPKRQKPHTAEVLAFSESTDASAELVDISLEEYSSVQFRLSNGAPGSFTTSQVCNGIKSSPEFMIAGSECTYAWSHLHPQELWIGHRDKPNEILLENSQLMHDSVKRFAFLPAGHPLGYNDAVLNLFRDFYGHLVTHELDSQGRRPTFRTGAEEMRILESILESVDEEAWITLR